MWCAWSLTAAQCIVNIVLDLRTSMTLGLLWPLGTPMTFRISLTLGLPLWTSLTFGISLTLGLPLLTSLTFRTSCAWPLGFIYLGTFLMIFWLSQTWRRRMRTSEILSYQMSQFQGSDCCCKKYILSRSLSEIIHEITHEIIHEITHEIIHEITHEMIHEITHEMIHEICMK